MTERMTCWNCGERSAALTLTGFCRGCGKLVGSLPTGDVDTDEDEQT